jgi:hypothetical protein
MVLNTKKCLLGCAAGIIIAVFSSMPANASNGHTLLPLATYTPANDVPLMILRYNKPRIYYSRQLYQVISRAVEIKPSVVFEIVSFIPKQPYESRREKMENEAKQNVNQLIEHMKEMGVPRERITVTRQQVDDGRYHEIYLYVD